MFETRFGSDFQMAVCSNMMSKCLTRRFGTHSTMKMNLYRRENRLIHTIGEVKATNRSRSKLIIKRNTFTVIQRRNNPRSSCRKYEKFRKIQILSFLPVSQRHYSTKNPYPVPSRDNALSSVPDGFYAIGVELLARHGSRTLTNNNVDDETIKLWCIADKKNLLTDFGQQLKRDVIFFIEENNKLGRGELTSIGRHEHREIGTRLSKRLEDLFDRRSSVSVLTSGKKRAIDSAEEFVSALIKSKSSINKLEEKPNKNILYFHKSCRKYLAFKNEDTDVRHQLNAIKNLPKSRIYAQQVLRRIYKRDFIEMLANGKFQSSLSSNENQNAEQNTRTRNEVDAVLSLYSLFSVALAHQSNSLRHLLAKYFTQEESNWFAYVNDAKEFYMKGPSIDGKTATYEMARPLLLDFFSSVSSAIDENHSVGARLRFAHAETIIPFATLLQIPGFSDQPVNKSDLYTYETNNWRGDRVSPMAANIQWEIYRHKDDAKRILVRMLYNEIEVKFKADCKSWTKDSFFYEFNELKRAYTNLC